MRSEGFPFIVGVWGWTCVRVAFVVSSSCRRRLVVASSSCRRRQLVANSLISLHWAVHSHCDTILTFKVWKVEEVSHEMLVLALSSHKMWGHFRVLRDRRNTLAVCQCKRVVFFVAGAALCDVAFRDVVAGAAFCDVAKVLFPRIAMAVTCKRDTTIVLGGGCNPVIH